MSSAAKLRTPGRVIAVAASAALVMTSFGPAAFAWYAPPTGLPAAADDAGAASIGLIDANDNVAGTQGATVVAPGQAGARIGDVRFVIPSTFQAGDSIDFILGDGGDITSTLDSDADPAPTAAQNQANIVSQQISFAAQPQVTIDSTPYAATTHVQSTSPTPATAAAPGSVEAGLETRYAGAGTPVAPTFTASLASSGTNQYNNVLRITFTSSSNQAVNTAKFIGAINGATINVGSGVATNQDLGLTARSYSNDSARTEENADIIWFGASTTVADDTTHDRTTYPATIATARMDVANGAVVADGTAQYVGPVTVTSASAMTGPVTWTVAGGTLDPSAPVTATAYDAGGNVIGTPSAGNATIGGGNTSVSYTPGAGAVRVVFSGMAVSTSASQLTYTLTGDGTGVAALTGALGSTLAASNLAQDEDPANRNQTDIIRPTGATEVSATTTVVPTRIGGTNRYETAVKIAEADRGADENGARGEADNVVIASGEAFPDALSAGYLAATKGAPILLTQRGELPSTVLEFLKNYGAKNVFIVGGSAAVSDRVEAQLRETQSFDIQARPQTQQRQVTTYDVSIPVQGAGPSAAVSLTGLRADLPRTVDVTTPRNATGGVAQDTVTTNIPGATVTNAPIGDGAGGSATITLATGESFTVRIPADSDTTSADQDTQFTTASTGTSTVTVTENVPNADTDSTAQGDDRMVVPLNTNLQVTRIAGDNRFETNRRVNEYAGVTSVTPIGTMVAQYGQPAKKTALVANGLAPWDALAAGPLVGNGAGNPVPLVLTAGNSLHPEARRQMQTMDIAHAILIGGDSVVPGGVSSELNSLNTTSTRLSGADRWGTARAITDFALRSNVASTTNTQPGLNFAGNGTHAPLLANGGVINPSLRDDSKWADALTAGAWAARTNSAIALTMTTELPGATRDMLTEHRATFDPAIAVGLGNAVSTEALNQANQAVAD